MKKKLNTWVILLLIFIIASGILYLVGMQDTFGLAGLSVVALVIALVVVFFML